MKQFIFAIIATLLASCKWTEENTHCNYCQYYIYNNSSHSVEIIERDHLSNSILHSYQCTTSDSIVISKKYYDGLLQPFEYNDVYISFDDSLIYNCNTHDYKICSVGWAFQNRHVNEDITVMEYIITDEDYNMVVSILNEEL